MKNFLKSDIVWESRKEILAFSHPQKTTPLVQSCQRDPEAPTLSLINQDLLYLKKENSGPKKIVLSLHKFPAIIFNDVDIEERTSRWVNKCVKKFNPYPWYGVEHWKNPHAKIFYVGPRILQVVLDLQHFESSPSIFTATILHISNIDNYVHQIIKFQSILITSSHYPGVVSPLATRKVYVI
ncbi:hypothetical protein Tco_0744424, partial [Tanacetum coccineum]